MNGYKRILLLVLIMTAVAMISTGTALNVLYETALEEKRSDLIQTAKSPARLMEAVARFDAQFKHYDHPGGAAEATLPQIREAHANYQGFGDIGEFTLARRQGDKIVFLLRHRYHDIDEPKPVPFTSSLAEPMRRALSGKSGTLVDRGEINA